MGNGYFGDFLTWYLDEDVESKLFRVWYDKDPESEEECSYEWFSQVIELPNGDILIGMRGYDDREEDCRSKSIYYHRLSEIQFAFCPSDMEDDD